MKSLLPLSFALAFAIISLVNPLRAQDVVFDDIYLQIDQGPSNVDKYYMDKISLRAAAPDRVEQTRNEMKGNPRNAAFAASFGKIESITPSRRKTK